MTGLARTLIAVIAAVTISTQISSQAFAQEDQAAEAQASPSGYSAPTGQKISTINVVGVERIEPATVLTYLDVREGDRMTAETLDRALKSLYATGLFSDVRLNQQGGTLEVQVSENPVINEIAFEGNRRIDDKELSAEIQLRSRDVFTRAKVQADVARLYQLYQRQGRFAVNIEPKAISLDQNRINLVFEIDEGDVTEVGTVRFVGNQRYDDDKLRSVISTKESRWYRFLSADDRYDPDRMLYDQELLRRFYLSQGYADFQVTASAAELANDRGSFFLTYTVDEGNRYKVGKVDIQSALRDFNPDVLKPRLTFKSGDWYNADAVQSSVDAIINALGDLQYAFVNVKPDIARNREGRIVDITLMISEAPRVFVERVDVSGNVRTLDKVIRRQVELVEGDPYNKTKLGKSETNIRDLGYFENVTVNARQGSMPDKTIVDINVSEQSTGELSVGAGFSTEDGPLADLRIKERNFLGKGQILSLGGTVAGERSQVDFSFTEPYFLDRDFSAGFDLYHITRDLQDESSFSQELSGGAVRFGYPLSEKWRQSVSYTLENNRVYDVDPFASRYIRDQEGERTTSAVSQRLTYDSRDSTLNPTNGLYSWLDLKVAGLGGNAKFYSGKLGSIYYYPVADKWTFSMLGEGGAIRAYSNDNVAINDRTFMGDTTLRGFERGGVGPRDLATDDSLGGNYFYRGSAELEFPVGLPEEMGIKAHAFTDAGSSWGLDKVAAGPTVVDENALRATAGIGISWKSPMGPVRVDMAKPYMQEDYDKEEFFRFNFGTRF